MPELDPESRERCERVGDQPITVAGEAIALLGIWFHLNGTIDTDWGVTGLSYYHVFVLPAPTSRFDCPVSPLTTAGFAQEEM